MSVLSIPVFAFFAVLTVLILAAGVRRLVGTALSPLRTLIAALIALFSATPIITAMAGPTLTSKHPGILPGLWFILLGTVIAVLVGMIFLAMSEALVPSGSLPGPLYVLRGTRRLAGRTRRYSHISRILARHGLIPYLRGGRRSELATPEGRTRLARSIRLALEDGGVTFVKLGQALSTRRDLLPAEFIGELSRLQDDAPKVPWPDIRQVLETSLGGPVTDKFASFDPEPIAAASIAQVHAAALPSGDHVVVKVRRPEVTGVVGSDLDIVQRLAGRLQRSTRWGRSVGAVDLAQGFADALREELDLRIEERNMTAVAAAIAARDEDLRVPAPHRPYCGERVLVMQYLDGGPLLTASAGLPAGSRAALARDLFDSLLGQVMLDGTFHADPPAGGTGGVPAGTGAGPFPRPALRGGRHADVRMFADLFRIVADYGLAVPPEIAAAFRSLATMEGTLTQHLTGLVHRVLLAFLAAAAGIMAVLMIGLRGGPAITKSVSLYSFFGYCLLVIAAILAVRVLVQVFRPDQG